MSKKIHILTVLFLIITFATIVDLVVLYVFQNPLSLISYAQNEQIPMIPNQKQSTFRRVSPIIPPDPFPTSNRSLVTPIPFDPNNNGQIPGQPGGPQSGSNPQTPEDPNACPVGGPINGCNCNTNNNVPTTTCSTADGEPVRYMENGDEVLIFYPGQDASYGDNPRPIPRSEFEGGVNSAQNCTETCAPFDKPVLYFYPEKPTYVSVFLDIPGVVTKSIPEYGTGWRNVLAHPDGSLLYEGRTYPELFYETMVQLPMAEQNKGFLIYMKSLKTDLTTILSAFGLNEFERNEFLEYWLPRLQQEKGPAFFMRVLTLEEKNKVDKVIITPQPDTFIHFLAEFKSVPEDYMYESAQLPKNSPARKGFTVVEWGGTVQ